MESIYLKFKRDYSNSAKDGVTFYKENLLFFNNISQFKNEDEFLMFLEVYYICITAFVVEKQYKNALSALKAMPVIENAMDRYEISRDSLRFYKLLLFQKACVLYYLRDYSSALRLLEQLNQYEPDNDQVKNWLESCKLIRKKRVASMLVIILIFLFITHQFLKDYQLKLICDAVEIVLFAICSYLVFSIAIKANRKLTI